MSTRVQNHLVVPASVQRQAGIKTGDRLKFKASLRTITITAVDQRNHKPTKAELVAIRKGEAEIARGQFVTLADLIDELDRRRRRVGEKKARKVSR